MVVSKLDVRDPASWAPVHRLVDELRANADVFVFLSGGASKMSPASQEALLHLLDALALLADRGARFAVGDGGTKAGLMEAAGRARAKSGNRFPLLGVAPAPEITTTGEPDKVPLDPNHSHVVVVDDPGWAERKAAAGERPNDYWGSEIEAMYTIFGRLADGRPSATIVANGGDNTLEEVRQNLAQGRRMIVVEGSGRAADAVVSVLTGRSGTGDDDGRLRALADRLDVRSRRDLFELFPLESGPSALADLLATRLASGQRRTTA